MPRGKEGEETKTQNVWGFASLCLCRLDRFCGSVLQGSFGLQKQRQTQAGNVFAAPGGGVCSLLRRERASVVIVAKFARRLAGVCRGIAPLARRRALNRRLCSGCVRAVRRLCTGRAPGRVRRVLGTPGCVPNTKNTEESSKTSSPISSKTSSN